MVGECTEIKSLPLFFYMFEIFYNNIHIFVLWEDVMLLCFTLFVCLFVVFTQSGCCCIAPTLFFIFLYLFLALLGLRFCARAFSSCSKRGPLFIAVRGPLTIAASLVAEHRLQTHRLSSCGSRAQLPRGMWDLPRPGLEPLSPVLAGRFSTPAPPGKP